MDTGIIQFPKREIPEELKTEDVVTLDEPANINLGNLYDINKKLMEKASMISKQQLNISKRELKEFFNVTPYSMLLCNERKDYTVFVAVGKYGIGAVNELLECLNNRGIIQSIEQQPDGNFEIWIKIEDESYVYYLFDYEFGIIEY